MTLNCCTDEALGSALQGCCVSVSAALSTDIGDGPVLFAGRFQAFVIERAGGNPV